MFKNLLLFLVILLVLYYLYNCMNNVENFDDVKTTDVDLNTSINMLGQIAKDLQEGGGLKVMGKLKLGEATLFWDDKSKCIVIDKPLLFSQFNKRIPI